jgi:phosphomannomutase
MAYDVRGRVPDELDEKLAYNIGRAYVQTVGAKEVVVGRDIRLSGPAISRALIEGITHSGADVIDIGLCGTEQVYFSTFHLGAGGGIMVTASHNPADYNGMKFVRAGSIPISGDTGLRDIESLAASGHFPPAVLKGSVNRRDTSIDYIDHLMGYIDASAIKPMKVVANAGNGCAGPVLDMIAERLPIELVRIHFEPDGTFPNGVPNPLLHENREATTKVIRETGASLGLAWDGDFDRCFFFDETGAFIDGYYLVGLLAKGVLEKAPGSKIVHDPRLTWNTIEVAEAAGGVPVMSKTGHAFIKERMRKEDAAYGGEMSAHHYFRDFAYCDSGMIPWLLVLETMSATGKPLSELVGNMAAKYPVSGEINRKVGDPKAVLAMVEEKYTPDAVSVDRTDGIAMEFDTWRFNLRMSNTEPLIRLNVEARGDRSLMEEKTDELLGMIQ